MCKLISPSAAFVLLLGSFMMRMAGAQFESPSAPKVAAFSVEIPASIREQLSSLPLGELPAARLRKLQFDMVMGSSTLSMETGYEQLENGLLGVSSIVNTSNSNQLTRMLTLRGMIELAGTSESTTETSIVLYSGFGAFTVNNVLAAESIYTTTALSGDLVALLHPKAGTQFSYVHSWASKQVTTSKPVSFKKTIDNIFTVTCTVASQSDASTLFGQLQGTYLPVVCDGKNREGKSFTNRYAYLLDSQMYVRLSESSTYVKANYKLTGAAYAP